ncbi:MAG TPA: pyridoxamine 5'-phosphate oxidase family protein [Egibacteraceae bacterium]|nr:pyridoxamine 5'-phosphate oxidase family protein [Egibacteraceae bacterium]
MTAEPASLHVLSADESLQLVAGHPIHLGRVGMTVDGWPLVLPVNYRLHEGRIIVRTADGQLLDTARRGERVAFEVDAVDLAWQEGWSVVIQGRASEVVDDDELSQLRRLPLKAWAGPRERFVQILPATITGRRIV